MPPRRAVELRVGGQTYRVVATDDDQHVQRLAELVDRKYGEVVPPGRGVTPQQAIFLTAMALAEEVEEQRSRAARLELERDHSKRLAARARDAVARLLQKVDSALSAGTSPQTTTHDAPKTAAATATAAPRSGPTPVPAATPSTERISAPPEDPADALLAELLAPPREQAPRGGLRLLRQPASNSWAASSPAKPTSSDDESR